MLELEDTERLVLDHLSNRDQACVQACLRAAGRQAPAGPDGSDDDPHPWLHVLTTWRMPAPVILAATLHAAPPGCRAEVRAQLGERAADTARVARRYAALLGRIRAATDAGATPHERQAETLRALFFAAFTDVEGVLMVLAAHAGRMARIEGIEYDAARAVCADNDAVFMPLAEMLGMWRLRRGLAESSLRRMNPRRAWDRIERQRAAVPEELASCRSALAQRLGRELEAVGVAAEVRAFEIPAATLHRRMLAGASLADVARRIRIDVLAASRPDCYRALECTHRLWRPLDWRTREGGAFRDMIAAPRYNGYRALFTAVDYRDDPGAKSVFPAEVRILTHEMDRVNQEGIVGARNLGPDPIASGAWWDDAATIELVRSRGVGGETDEVYAFSPRGEVYLLPLASTPIDFAYRVHSEVGHRCKRVRINGKPARYDRRLANGDLVSIESHPDASGPDPRWLPSVRTSTAKMHIKRALRQSRAGPPAGRRIVDRILARELEAHAMPAADPAEWERFLSRLARERRFADVSELYDEIASGGSSIASGGSSSPSAGLAPDEIAARWIAGQLAGYVARADGQALGVPVARVRFAHCPNGRRRFCASLGDDIAGGFHQLGTPHARLVVHRRDCPNAGGAGAAIDLTWQVSDQPDVVVKVAVEAFDRRGLLDDVLRPVYEVQGLYLLQAHAEVDQRRDARILFTIEAAGDDRLARLDEKLKALAQGGTVKTYAIHTLSEVEKVLLAKRKAVANPYTTIAVRDQRLFKGRHFEIARIEATLRTAQNLTILYGINRVGKTSLLRFLAHSVLAQRDFVPAVVDMQGIPEYREGALWDRMADAIVRAVDHQYGTAARRSMGIQPYKARGGREAWTFDAWLRRVAEALRGARLVILIDELNLVDELWDPREGERAIRRLKATVESVEQAQFVVCVQETFYRAREGRDGQSDVSAALLRLGVTVRLDYLDPEASERLIRDPMGQVLAYDDAVVRRIVHLTSGHPYYLQNLLHRLVNRVLQDQRREVRPADLEAVVSDLLDHGEQLFFDFARHSEGPRRSVLEALAFAAGPDHQGVTLDALVRTLHDHGLGLTPAAVARMLLDLDNAGVVKRREIYGGPHFNLRVPLFSDWLRLYRPMPPASL